SRDEERGHGEDEPRARRQAPDVPDDEFDPHDVLGVPKGASLAVIRAAHDEAKAKYDPKLAVDFGGAELQAYFEAKAKAIERAFQLLTKKFPLPFPISFRVAAALRLWCY